MDNSTFAPHFNSDGVWTVCEHAYDPNPISVAEIKQCLGQHNSIKPEDWDVMISEDERAEAIRIGRIGLKRAETMENIATVLGFAFIVFIWGFSIYNAIGA